MTGFAALAAFLLAALAPAAAAAAAPVRAMTTQTLPSLFSDADYPAAAIRNHEQGPVGFRLDVGPDGRVAACSVVSSSGSQSLDSTTCRLLTERARFTPARDAKGRPTADTFTGRIIWRLAAAAGPRLQAAQMLWKTCVMGEASKLVPGDLPAAEIARRSFPPCTALEALVARELKAPMPLDQSRADLAGTIGNELPGARTALRAPPQAEAPRD
ncbi:MAG: periplasmic protein TonB [Sphingomonadales bacterium]|nr:periplasmic protein TonB [Sphingomonadales bacterium]